MHGDAAGSLRGLRHGAPVLTALTVNGEPFELDAEPATVDTLVETLGVGRRGVAVAVNGTVIPRSSWPLTPLTPGDAIEVLHAVKGGC